MYLIYNYILPVYAPHALQRFEVFMNPDLDPRGIGYNVIQSKLAIGSGQIFGMGMFKGTQAQLRIFTSKNNRFYLFINIRRVSDLLFQEWLLYYIYF